MKDMNIEENNVDTPTISTALIDYLESVYPKKDFTPDCGSLREIDFHCGQRSVVRFLQHQHQIQNENILNNV